MLIHWSVCLPFFHRGKLTSCTLAAASAKVGIFARRFSARGSRPSATASLCASANWRALASDTAGYPPSPMSRRRPSIVARSIQPFEPPGATLRYRPLPSWCMPGLVSAFTFAAVSAVMVLAHQFAHHSKREYTASCEHRQHNMATTTTCYQWVSRLLREHLGSGTGGGSGIRTHDTVPRIHAFQACALSHSATPPIPRRYRQTQRAMTARICGTISGNPAIATIGSQRTMDTAGFTHADGSCRCEWDAGADHLKGAKVGNTHAISSGYGVNFRIIKGSSPCVFGTF